MEYFLLDFVHDKAVRIINLGGVSLIVLGIHIFL
jgi:hypothetical protein